MPTQLPALNTEGLNIAPTLNTIRQIELGDLQKQNLQSEIDARPALKALRMAQEQRAAKTAELEQRKADKEFDESHQKDLSQSLRWLQGLPDDQLPGAYKIWYNTQTGRYKEAEGTPLAGRVGIHPAMTLNPESATPDQIKKYAEMSHYAVEKKATGKPGEKITALTNSSMVNPEMLEKYNIDPKTNPYVKMESVLDINNKPAIVGIAPALEFQEKKEEAKAKIEESKRTHDETIRHNKKQEGFEGAKVGIAREQLSLAKKRLENAQNKPLGTYTNAAGEVLIQDTEGDFIKQDGTVAEPIDLVGLNRVGVAKAGKGGRASAAAAGGGSTPAAGSYKSADEVKAAFQSKKISKEEATEILQTKFGYQ